MQVFFRSLFLCFLSLAYLRLYLGHPGLVMSCRLLYILTNRLEFKKPRFRDSTEVVHAASKVLAVFLRRPKRRCLRHGLQGRS